MKRTSALFLISLLASCHSTEATAPTESVPLKWSPGESLKAPAQPNSGSEDGLANQPQTSPLQNETVPIEDRLEKLASLFAAGSLTEAEYAKAKATALNSTPPVEISPDDLEPVAPEKEPLPLGVLDNTASPVVKTTENGNHLDSSITGGHAAEPEQNSGHTGLSFMQASWIQHERFRGLEFDLSRELSGSTFAACSAAKTSAHGGITQDTYHFTVEAGFYRRANENCTLYGSFLAAHEILDAPESTEEDTYLYLRGGGIYSITERLALAFELNHPINGDSIINPFGFLSARYLANDTVSVGVEMNVVGNFRKEALLFGLRFNQ